MGGYYYFIVNEIIDITKYGIEKLGEDEVFKPIKFGEYFFSNYGRVFSKLYEKFLTVHKGSFGEYIYLNHNSQRKFFSIPSLIIENFLDNHDYDLIYPLDGDVSNSFFKNLLPLKADEYLEKYIPKIGVDEKFTKILEEDGYFISNYGRIYSISSKSIFRTKAKINKVIKVTINKNYYYLNHLVARYFIPNANPENKCVYFIDKNKINFYYKNLAWGKVNEGKFKDVSGKRFNKLIIIEKDLVKSNYQSIYWKCKCDCGNFVSARVSDLRGGQKSCGCLNKDKPSRSNHPLWGGYKEISGSFYSSVKRGAEDRNIFFDTSIEDLWEQFVKQNRKCNLSGKELKFRSRSDIPDGTASVDRIDSSKGYTIDNIQFIHKDINTMKMDFSQEYFIETCTLISNNRK